MDAEPHPNYAHNGDHARLRLHRLLSMVLMVIFFHSYRHFCLRRHHHHLIIPTFTSTTIAADSNEPLGPSFLKLLPTFTYSSTSHHRRLQECAVCLSEFEDGDTGRVLPNCNHAFHCHCIDKWFRSRSNCPLCRTPVRPLKIEPVGSVSSFDVEPTLFFLFVSLVHSQKVTQVARLFHHPLGAQESH
ncbi:hypothetical protein L6164_034712 [Bauhinia variegata]|uniref:Uncharacterized protein n=1 Tax=Bauhinia variegata TaxID=167791 RepID=A0ACB9KWC8_BAUVA|nr:hypothetical protein L6164_034712 [Bauhinia variegata]